MSRIVTLYRTVARYRLDQLLPSNQRPRLFSLLLMRGRRERDGLIQCTLGARQCRAQQCRVVLSHALRPR